MRVLTYNIAGHKGRRRPQHLEEVAELIRSLSPDVVALQEVIHSGDEPSPEDILAELTGMHAAYLPAHHARGRSLGNAVLCREPILNMQGLELPGRFPERRALLEVQTSTAGKPLTVFNTHLVHLAHAGAPLRRLQAAAVARRMLLCPGAYVLLGDLNASPHARELHAVRSATNRTDHHRGLRSWPAHRPVIQYDHVWPGPGFEVEYVRSLGRHVSDHRPVLAQLRWRKPSESA